MTKKLCIGLLLILCFASGCTLFRPSPVGTTTKYLDALKAGKYADMYRFLTSEAKSKVNEARFTSLYQTIYQQIGVTAVNLDLASDKKRWPVKKNRTEIPVQGTLATWTVGDIAVNQILRMVYEEKTWRIDWQATNILPQMTELNYRVVVSRSFPDRGNIYDRNGEIIAGAGPIYRIGLVPGKMTNPEGAIPRLAALLDFTPEQIQKILNQKWVKADHFVPLRSISRAEWQTKKDQLLAIPGVIVSSATGRIYTDAESLSPTIGYLGEISDKEFQAGIKEGYQHGDLIGKDGLEKRFERALAGKPGFTIRIVDQMGEEQAMVQSTEAENGRDLNLTIDMRLQRVIEKAMGDRSGMAVALNPRTGEVLAIGSFPGYDSSEFVLGRASNQVKQYLKDPLTPLLNRPLRGRYIPGSTLKPFTALAALEFDPKYNPLEKVNLPENTWKADPSWGSYSVRRVPRPSGLVDLYGAMKWSDNIYFAQLAYRMGSEPLFKMADRAGFGMKIPFVLDVTQSSLSRQNPITNTIQLADTGYGQGQVLMSPLHMTMLYAAIATDGKMRIPVLTSGEQAKIWFDEPLASPDHLALIKDVLKVTVQDRAAIAHVADIPGLDMAGKTGTAQNSNNTETGWFISYHPAVDPEMVLLVGVEKAVHGSHDALALTRQILTQYYELNP